MGYGIAESAVRRRHKVTLISGPTAIIPPKVDKFIRIETADDLLRELKREIKKVDCLIMCAAVGDFRPSSVAKRKIRRKTNLLVKLVPNKDLLKELGRYKKSKLFIGFSLETENFTKNAVQKLKTKNLDLIISNRLTKKHNPFGDNKLEVNIIDKKGHSLYINNKSKAYISNVLLDKIERLWYLERKDIL